MKRKRVITIELEREITTTQTTRAIRFQHAARETEAEAQVAPEKPDEPVLRALAAAVCCLEDDANET
jgi:hypothetical protein